MTSDWKDRPIEVGKDAVPTRAAATEMQGDRAMLLARAIGIRRPTRSQADRILAILTPYVPGLSIADAQGRVVIDGAPWTPPLGGRPSWPDEDLGTLNWAVERIQIFSRDHGEHISIKQAIERLRDGMVKGGRERGKVQSVRTFQNLLSIARRRGLWHPPSTVDDNERGSVWDLHSS